MPSKRNVRKIRLSRRLRLNPYDIAYPDIGNLRYLDSNRYYFVRYLYVAFMFAGTSILEFAFIETTGWYEKSSFRERGREREPCILRRIVRREFIIEWLNNMCKITLLDVKQFDIIVLNMFIYALRICFARIRHFAFRCLNYNGALAFPIRKWFYRLFYANVNVLDNVLAVMFPLSLTWRIHVRP